MHFLGPTVVASVVAAVGWLNADDTISPRDIGAGAAPEGAVLMTAAPIETTFPASDCDLYKARDMCCPIWCAGKDRNVFDAAKALSSCARGYGCTWDDTPSGARFQCSSACK